MKNGLMGFFGIYLALAVTSAFAGNDTEWHTVLSCDKGAAVVDNITGYGRGGAGLAAQLVIRDPNIVYYFLKNQAQNSFEDGQWIGKSYFEPIQGGAPADVLLNFRTDGFVVASSENTLTVTSGGANWTFRDCVRN